jgi:peptidoglycan/LPS O-acetylase OafA/YrhL
MQVRAELRPLTSVRGIAAWFVVLYHVRLAAAPTLGPDLVAIFARGYLAVDFFFMLSGFVIWLNYAGRLREGGLSSAPAFLWRRMARVYPLHIVILIGALVLVAANMLTGRGIPSAYPIAELPLHLLLIQNWGFTSHLSWNDPAWSISCEFAAYLLFPFVACAIDWKRLPSAALLIIATALILMLYGVMSLAGIERLGTDLTRFGVLRCLTQFMAGTVLCTLWIRWREAPMLPSLISAVIALAAFMSFLFGGPETLLVPIVFAGLLLALALTGEHPRNPLGGKLIHYLGEISYATYMVHFLLFVAFKLAFVPDPFDIGAGRLAAFLVLTLIVSMLLYHMVERPAQKWLNRRGPRSAHRDSTSSINAAVN